jgi:phosphoglucosamine mutase
VAVRFGTDGIRGLANADLTVDLALALGRAVSEVFGARRAVIGRDTRRSGPMLQAAVAAGLASGGCDVLDLGVVPTPAVAWAAAQAELPGVVVSASHNSFQDNGLKVFRPGGRKLTDADERALAARIEAWLADPDPSGRPRPTGAGVGALLEATEWAEGYLGALEQALEGRDLAGLRVVLDCAHGAAYRLGPLLLERLGALVRVLGAEPDGTNINDGCGSTNPAGLAAAVVADGAELGLALDGDADRLVAVDHRGRVVTGDHLLALFAADLRERGRLPGDAVVATVMSNLGLRRALEDLGVGLRETPVGDRYVLEALEAEGLALGGEQSGHLVFRELSTTGDGLLTGVLLADLVRRRGQPLAALADAALTWVPQRLVNVAVPDPAGCVEDPRVRRAVTEAARRLGREGRVLVRASGTEPVIRLMVEAVDAQLADAVLAELEQAVTAAGLPAPDVPGPSVPGPGVPAPGGASP